MDKVAALLDKYPNADVEISASIQDLGRAPLMIWKFLIKYQPEGVFLISFDQSMPSAESIVAATFSILTRLVAALPARVEALRAFALGPLQNAPRLDARAAKERREAAL